MIVQGELVARWVMQPIGAYTERMSAIGMQNDEGFIAGVAFENWNGNNMFGHMRIDGKTTRYFWYCLADYIFNCCGVKRFTATVEESNVRAIRLNKHIGFKTEAILKDAGKTGNLLVMVLWKEDCKMLDWNKHG